MSEPDAILGALTPIVDGVVATLGSFCEVVLHDFRRSRSSVVAIAGSVTDRAVGAAMSEIGMRLLALGDAATDELNYITRTPSGKLMKSSTMVLRDSGGSVFGALCINLDLTALTQVQTLVGELAETTTPTTAPTTTFSQDVDAIVDATVDEHQLRLNKPWAALTREERRELFRSLNARGVFTLRRAVPQVADRLGISRASAYSYLADIRAQGES